MIEQNDKEYFNVNGMMIYDPSIQYPVTSEVAALPFVDGKSIVTGSMEKRYADQMMILAHADDFPFNDTYIAY